MKWFILLLLPFIMGNAKMIFDTNKYALIKKFEGFRSKPYRCDAGVITNGNGTTSYPLGKVKMTDRPISKIEAHILLELHINKKILPYIKELKLNANQKEAIISFIYNVGIGAFKKSIYGLLLNDEYKKASAKILLYNKFRKNGKLIVSKGLTRRRKAEYELFNRPMEKTLAQVKPKWKLW